MQILIISGNVGKDAVLRNTPGGDSVLNFSLAVDNGKDSNGNKRDATWYDCSLWGKRANSLQNHITKGCKLSLSGRPTARAHEGKVYLGISVNELTFMGGGEKHNDMPPGYDGSAPADADKRRGGGPSFDDEIPFSMEWRA